MSKHKYTTAVCLVIVVAMLAATILFMSGASLGIEVIKSQPLYAQKLFTTDRVHTIDIVVSSTDWDNMLANAQAEEYIQCSVVIDGESVKGVGLRPKGNSSLSMIAISDSERYSFKVEFDHYEKGKSYFGLDKLALNNIAQDNTYMKDYVTYQMMNAMGANAPLSSFIWVTVNGEDWGLYLAAEGVEESFAQRVYGSDFGEIYKPDIMDMGGVQRNIIGENGEEIIFVDGELPEGEFPMQGGRIPDFENGELPDFENMPQNGEMPQMPENGGGRGGQMPEGEFPVQGGQRFNIDGGMNSGETSLVYTDEDPDSYSAIFDNAVFKNVSDSDKTRLIEALKQLNKGENIAEVVDVDEVIRYFVVHNFVLNTDSYTGSIVHNYYLAENDGQLSMIAWDYNLAFGGMGAMMGGFGTETETATDTATSLVNYPIDSPMLSGTVEDKPMIAWIFENEEYLAKYHEVFAEYMEYFSCGEFEKMYDEAIAAISPYVEKDPSAFCTYEDFQKGSAALREFCLRRAESITGQLVGTIASTSQGQTASKEGFIDASDIDISDMGSNSMGFGMARGGDFEFKFWNMD